MIDSARQSKGGFALWRRLAAVGGSLVLARLGSRRGSKAGARTIHSACRLVPFGVGSHGRAARSLVLHSMLLSLLPLLYSSLPLDGLVVVSPSRMDWTPASRRTCTAVVRCIRRGFCILM